jgi:hypothetical protein
MPYITVSTRQGHSGHRAEAGAAGADHRSDGRNRRAGQSGIPQVGLGQDRGGRARELEPRRHDADCGSDRDDFWTDRSRRKADGKGVAGERRIKLSAFARLAVAEAVG